MSELSPNPSLLKLDLAVRGAQLHESTLVRTEIGQPPWLGEQVPTSIELVLPEDVWVNVPIGQEFARHSPYQLVADDQQFWITSNGARCAVRVAPQPTYYAKETSSGTPMWRVGTTYGSYIAINPAAACTTTRLGTPCRFCDSGARAGNRPNPLPITDVVETVGAAFAEGAVELVYFHVGRRDEEDAGVSFLEPYVHAVKKHFDTLVAVQLEPPLDNRSIARTYAMGADGLSYSIAIHDAALLRELCADRPHDVERDRYYEALRYAASIFPSGTVWSDLIVGLEPPASTIAGIDVLVGMGVLPVLSLVSPEDSPRGHPVSPAADLTGVLAHLFDAVRHAKINMHWVRDLGSAVTPLEARFFSADGANALGVGGQFYRSRLGGLAARNLSRMRRRLRVRKVSDSFDASHL